jgi:hypothetical protein
MNAGWLPLGTGAAPQALPLRGVPLSALKAKRMPAQNCGPQKEKTLWIVLFFEHTVVPVPKHLALRVTAEAVHAFLGGAAISDSPSETYAN